MYVLGIETTCDETACAVVKNGSGILSNVVASQIELHAAFGGVVPELACRRHVDALLPVIKEALNEANLSLPDIDLIAVSYGPGLIGALLIGLTSAKALSLATGIPFIGINHIEAHLYAAIMTNERPVNFPCLGVVISGGHTALVEIQSIGQYRLIGQTVDDAIGEAFDKVGKLLDLPYPAGPMIENMALQGNPQKFPFKGGKVKGKPLDFSFSGLKTSVLYAWRGQNSQGPLKEWTAQDRCDVAASFQRAAFDDLIDKVLKASSITQSKTILFGGGVSNNQALRQQFAKKAPQLKCLWPSKGLSLDNAAMIAGLGYHKFLEKGKGDPLDFEAATNLRFA